MGRERERAHGDDIVLCMCAVFVYGCAGVHMCVCMVFFNYYLDCETLVTPSVLNLKIDHFHCMFKARINEEDCGRSVTASEKYYTF